MTEQVLGQKVLESLRQKGLISEEEIAIQVGDKLIAEHVLSRDRRVLNVDTTILNESGPRLLKS
jgi:hypothetical protein